MFVVLIGGTRAAPCSSTAQATLKLSIPVVIRVITVSAWAPKVIGKPIKETEWNVSTEVKKRE